ncbi:MAG TPA: hypothetical protein VFE16_12355 [Candidatus Cybelea sp.]|nr:hypothetical protein [Candidatus Cybelea sp.]
MRFFCLAVALSIAACSGLGSRDAVPTASGANVVPANISPGCTGNCIPTCKGPGFSNKGHISIAPCPITLSREQGRKGVVVTVSERGIAGAAPFRRAECHEGGRVDPHNHKWYCHLEAVGGKQTTQWSVVPGTVCGKTDVLFKAYNDGKELIGNVYLPVTNKYCM